MDNSILIAGFLSAGALISFSKAAFGLGVVIFVHELGHFLVAKACGVKCEKFYIGFDPPISIGAIKLPRTLFKKQWGETEYGIGIIPLGGYVKMLGQDDNPSNASAEAERIRIEGDQLDPRSYPAKSVPQRMAIISAGVVFNLIFGVLFAAIAYKMGVTYTPTVIGGASVGDPAWLAGIQPGDRIVALEEEAPINEKLRFTNDLKFKMFSLGRHPVSDEFENIHMRLQNASGEIRNINITPNEAYSSLVGTPTIGVRMAKSPVIYAVIDGSIAQTAGLKPGDRIHAIAVDGERTEIDVDGIGIDLQQVMARSQHLPITLSVTRTDKESKEESQHDITIGVDSSERFGIELTMGPIECVQEGSLADQLGLRKGDVITTINGEAVGDPLTLPIRLLSFIGNNMELEFIRGTTTQQVQFVMPAPKTVSTVQRRDGPIGLDALGIGYVMHPTVSGIVPGSPAEAAGLEVGDVLQQVNLIYPQRPIPEDKKWKRFQGFQEYQHQRRTQRMLKAFELNYNIAIDDTKNNWPFVVNSVQNSVTKFEIDLTYDRGGQVNTVRLAPVRSKTTVDTSRGFVLKGYEEVRVAESWSEAIALGAREIGDGIKQVVFVLRKIPSNYQNLGGPLTIVTAATMEASEGLPRLLVFLTLLSANLAVLNFLPIPVLDGGHMLFLAYEGIVGKPVDERVQMSLTLVGFSLLMCLMVFVFGLDISRWL